jgi:6-pyruvoyltetrahydropterin/6-carboxytetrahydropterin synthase
MWSLKLAKDAFKFSGAHFTTFSDKEAELLHGHNYYVAVTLEGCSKLNHGMIVDLAEPKKLIKELLNSIDEKVLLAKNDPYTKVEEQDSQIQVSFNNKSYSFPKEDCFIFPVENITIEALSGYIGGSLKAAFSKYPITSFTVEVSETRGQSCIYRVQTKAQS